MNNTEERFERNSQELQRLGVETSWAENDAWVQITGANIDLAIRLARALTAKLDNGDGAECRGEKFEFLYDMDLREAVDRTNKERSPLFESRPQQENFAVRVDSPAKGENILIAEVRDQDKANPELSRREALRLGYFAMIRAVELTPVKDELQESLEETIEQIEVEVRGSSKTAKEVRGDREKDLESAPETFRLLGVKEAGDLSQLNELWEDRSLDRIAIVDLFLHIVEEKQQRIGRKGIEFVPEIKLKDLVETGKHLPAADLRGEQQRQSAKIFVELGYDPKEIERRFINADKSRALGFRYAGWLLGQPFMEDCRTTISQELVKKGNIPSAVLFVKITAAAGKAYKSHKENKKEEDLSISWRREEHLKELEFLKTCVMLCMNVFFDKDISDLVKDR